MKKALLVFISLFLLTPTFMAQSEVRKGQVGLIQPAGVTLKAEKIDDRFIIALHFKKESSQPYAIKAVKVTFEPSGTIPLAVSCEKYADKVNSGFLAFKRPLSSIETSAISMEELAPKISLDYPPEIGQDNLIRIEYLVEKDGVLSIVTAAVMGVENTSSIDFAVTPLQRGGGFTIYCGCCDCARSCPTFEGSCCCACEFPPTCGIVKCPPPPC